MAALNISNFIKKYRFQWNFPIHFSLQLRVVDSRLFVSHSGVAGRFDEIRNFSIIIVAAGMDAALPSVIGGLVPNLIIGLPTSTGYGASDLGKTAMNAMLASCAPGIAVVNIDNGYGAACVAMRAIRANK